MTQHPEDWIRERAYAIWEREGRPDGRSVEHWLLAEEELLEVGLNGVTEDGRPVKSAKASARPARPKTADKLPRR